MAATFQVNINITAGVDFQQQYTLTGSDMVPTDLTGFIFSGNIAKHECAVNATTSTSTDPVWKVMPLTITVPNPTSGVYVISLTAEQTTKLKEGKYVYSVVVTDTTPTTSEVVSGLAFVDKAFGILTGTTETYSSYY